MDEQCCPVCDLPFKDKDPIVAVMLSEYKIIPSDVHYAIKQPTQCFEIAHFHCYDRQDHFGPQVEGAN